MYKRSKCEQNLVAPDGGWGYMNVVAGVINLVIFTTYESNYGILYKDLFIQLSMDTATISFLNNLTAVSYALSGFMTSPLLKLLSIRKLALVAATALSFGQFSSVFVQNKALLFLSQGLIQFRMAELEVEVNKDIASAIPVVLMSVSTSNFSYALLGFGTGVLYNLSFTVITQYFDKKRLLAVSIAQISAAISVLVTPKLVKWYLEMYEVRGTLLCLSAVTLNTIVGAVLMQPVSWHRRKVIPETNEIEMKFLFTENDNRNSKLPTVGLNNPKTNVETGTNNSETSKNLIRCDLNIKRNGIDKIFGDFTDAIMRKKFLLSITPLGLSLAGFVDVKFIKMLPHALYYMTWNQNDISWAMLLQLIGDLITKIVFILTHSWLNKFEGRELYICGLLIALFTRIGMLWSDNPTVIIIFLSIMGISKCTIELLAPLVIAESMGTEKFSAAIGIVMLLSGVFKLLLAPVIDAVRDLTDSYSTAFYIMSSFYGIIIMFWSIELLYKKNKHKWAKKKEVLKMGN